jgi:hypothetical protein
MSSLTTAKPDSRATRQRSVEKFQTQVSSAQAETTTIEAAAVRLGIGRSLAYQLARSNQFQCPIIKAGRRLLVPIAGLDRVLAGLRQS